VARGEGRPWRALDGYVVTKEHGVEHGGAVERGSSSGLFYLPLAVLISHGP
jgi:hypothetical protein